MQNVGFNEYRSKAEQSLDSIFVQTRIQKNSKDSTGGGLNPHNPPLGTTAYSSLVSLEEFKVNPNVNLPPEHAHSSTDLIFCMLNLFLTFS